MSSLDERIALATAPAWRPEPGDKLEEATVVRLMMGHTDDYGDYPIVVYRQKDGSFIKVHAFHQVLRERYIELKTKPGDVQNVVYIDRRTANKQKGNGETTEYELYYVEPFDPKADKQDVTGVEEGFAF